MSKKKWTDEQFVKAVTENNSIAGVIKTLGLIPAGGNYETVTKKIKELNLDISHFTGQGWNVGLKFKPIETKPLSEILVDGCYYNSYKLKNRLIREGLKNCKCERCGRTTWENETIPLELHHINGNRSDNRLDNLQVLCPNCHALTDNYRGKNKKVN
jgi:Zn finger protein HypA/HybF involved in hydrogenase expression